MKALMWIFLSGLAVIILFGQVEPSGPTPQTSTTASFAGRVPSVTPAYEPKSPVHVFANVKINQWKRGGFDTVAIVDLTVTNTGERGMKDIEITCRVSAESGTILSSIRHTLYIPLAPRESRRQRQVNLGFIHAQAARLGCDATSAKET
jgi:hypothetical protein